MESPNLLGEFLRARRALVRPEDAGLPGNGLRRVAGLRREEVAFLAGISSDYYLRLEQGRDRNPSEQVLHAIAKVLHLDAEATTYLISIARASTDQARRSAPSRSRGATEPVPASILQLINGLTDHPAYVQTKFSDVLAANSLATALSPNYAPGVNLLRATLLDDAERKLRRNWKELAEESIAALRSHLGPDIDHPRMRELVDELSARSEWFRRQWARHDVRPKFGHLVMQFDHPLVGELDLHAEKLTINDTDGLLLCIFHPEQGSRSAELMKVLGSLATPEPVDER
jgi:transcriptional regulator with XRE-family HTH domain